MSPCFQNSANRKTELTEKGIFHIFAANGKRKRQISVLFAADGIRKWKFVFFGWQTINVNQLLLFQELCPSMIKN
jgi:hypothetical protein